MNKRVECELCKVWLIENRPNGEVNEKRKEKLYDRTQEEFTNMEFRIRENKVWIKTFIAAYLRR